MSELLPCPFCGEQPVSCFVGEDDGGYWSTECSTKNHFAGVHAMTQETAEAEWNTRANVEGLDKGELQVLIDYHDHKETEADAWGDGVPECVKYHREKSGCYTKALAEHARTKEGE